MADVSRGIPLAGSDVLFHVHHMELLIALEYLRIPTDSGMNGHWPLWSLLGKPGQVWTSSLQDLENLRSTLAEKN